MARKPSADRGPPRCPSIGSPVRRFTHRPLPPVDYRVAEPALLFIVFLSRFQSEPFATTSRATELRPRVLVGGPAHLRRRRCRESQQSCGQEPFVSWFSPHSGVRCWRVPPACDRPRRTRHGGHAADQPAPGRRVRRRAHRPRAVPSRIIAQKARWTHRLPPKSGKRRRDGRFTSAARAALTAGVAITPPGHPGRRRREEPAAFPPRGRQIYGGPASADWYLWFTGLQPRCHFRLRVDVRRSARGDAFEEPDRGELRLLGRRARCSADCRTTARCWCWVYTSTRRSRVHER